MSREVIIERPEALLLVDDFAVYSSGALLPAQTTKEDPKEPVKDRSVIPTDYKIAFWGDNNDWPQQIDKDLELNVDLWRSLDMNSRALYGGGVEYMVYNYKDNTYTKKRIFEIDQFLFRNRHYPLNASIDFYKYYNVFPQFIVNRGKDKIVWLTTQKAGHCRYSLQESDGSIKHVYLNANWADRATWMDALSNKVPVLDPVTTTVESMKERKDGPKYIYPLSYPTGKTYYQLPIWAGIRQNGWLKLANEIPKLKAAIMKNQLTIKYHIRFPDYYWGWKYAEWESFDAKKKNELKKKEFDDIKNFLQGSENAGKSIATGYKIDEETMKPYPGVEIIPIDDKMKTGIYIEDSTEASIKIFSAAGIDPSIFGFQLGKGSNLNGSDKRESHNIFVTYLKPHQDLLLTPYDFVSWFNGWNNSTELIIWNFSRVLMQMLNAVTPSERETKNPEVDNATE